MDARRFQDRRDAGRALAEELRRTWSAGDGGGATAGENRHDDGNRDPGPRGHGAGRHDGAPGPVVLALPRGGVPVAAEVAAGLDAELDILVVRKIGVPAHPELAMGALALLAGTVETVRNEDVIAQVPGAGRPGAAFDMVAETEGRELLRRDAAYRQDRPPAQLAGRTVIIVDDGLATGASMRAALIAARRQEPEHLVAAVPVGSPATLATLDELADEVVSAWVSENLGSVGQAYETFGQTSDEEVQQILGSYGQAGDG